MHGIAVAHPDLLVVAPAREQRAFGGQMQPGETVLALLSGPHVATEKARKLGATVMREPMEVMGAGWLSVIVDPTGATLGLWKATGQS